MTYDDALRTGISRLSTANIPDAARDARWLLAFAADVKRDRLSVLGPDEISAAALARYETALDRRLAREPVSQITGEKLFYGRSFHVDGDVLTPRPETETLIELALAAPFHRVLDLGTGSGAILVTLLAERPEAEGVGTDISEDAVLMAGRNAARHDVADRIILPVSDWWDDVGGRFDLIVSNPPYIAFDEMTSLAPDVRDFEPRAALTDDADGLTAYRRITNGVRNHMTLRGRLLVEIGPTQGFAVAEMFDEAGLRDVRIHPDLDGRDRVVSGVAGRLEA